MTQLPSLARRDQEPAANSSPSDPLQNVDFEQIVKNSLEQWRVPGMAIAVLDGPHTWSRGFGFSVLPDRRVTPTTNYYAGSTTKAFVAAAMSTLVTDDDNHPEIQWNTPISKIIRDDFVLEDPWATDHVSIEDALSHRTGLPRHDRAYGRKLDKTTPRDRPAPIVREMVRQLRHLPMTAEPRTTYQYCNLMFVVSAHVIETVTGTWLGDYLKEKIWQPLGMSNTFFDTEDAKEAKVDLAQGYKYNQAESRYEEVPWMDLDSASGAGAVISNVTDYAKWARAIMERTTSLKGVDWEALTAARSIIPDDKTKPFTGASTYALGWHTGVYKGHHFLEHSGGMNCFGAELIIFPDIQYAFVGLANTAATSNFAELSLGYHLIDEKLGVPKAERFDWDAKNRSTLETGKKRADGAKEHFYPDLPAEPLPLQRPLAAHAGTYFHPGYQTLEIYFDEERGILRADRNETTWPEYMKFEHVSGEHFVVVSNWDGDFAAFFPDTYAVEFIVGANGVVNKVGITWEEKMNGQKIWLERVQGK